MSIDKKLDPLTKKLIDSSTRLRSFGKTLAILTDKLVILWDASAFETLPSKGYILSDFSLDQKLYIVDSEMGLLRLEKREWVPIANGQFFSASAFTLNANHELFGISLSDGLLRINLEGGNLEYSAITRQDRTAILGVAFSQIVDLDQSIYVGTLGKGLVAYSKRTGLAVNLGEKLRKEIGLDILALAADSQGRLWIGTRGGILILAPGSGAASSHAGAEQKSEIFAYIRSCVSMKDQAVIFGGAFFQELGGVQTLEASTLNRPELPFSQNALRFSFASSDLANAESIHFQTYLEGYDEGWTEWSDRNFREFTNLVWKKYNFKVRAKKPDGTISPITSFEFRLLPPWYEQYWFYFLQLLILLFLMIIVTYLKGWTKRDSTTEKLNGVVVGTIWGYTFSKVGVQGVVWAMSGGAAFLAIIANAFMGIFLKPLQKKLEARIIKVEEKLIHKYKSKSEIQEQKILKLIKTMKSKTRVKRAGVLRKMKHRRKPANPNNVIILRRKVQNRYQPQAPFKKSA